MNEETEAQRVAEFLSATFETIDQGVTIYDSELRLVAWNDQYQKLNLVPDKYCQYGASLIELYRDLADQGSFGPGDPDSLFEQHVAAMRDGPLIEEELLTTPQKRSLRIRRFRLPNKGVVATFTDVTEELEVQEQLRQSSKMDAIGRLTGGVAHDFNNVLAIIIGNIELALEDQSTGKSKKLLEAAIEASERGARMTHRLLAFARKQALSPEITHPNLILSELVPMLRTLLGEHIEVEFVCDAGIWSVEVDRNQLENVIVNIAINARDAMSDGGKLTIEAFNARVDAHYAKLADIKRGQYVCLACTDSGAGMTKEVLDKAFEPFFTTKEIGAGTGLGLAMAHGFVKQSNGHIKIYSELGEGTTLKIYLPRVNGSQVPDRSELEAIRDPNSAETLILVVEDDDQFRETVCAQLRSEGYRVLAAKDGPTALKHLEETENIDILLTDVVLPGGINGRKLAARVLERKPDISIIYMSGYSENAIIHHGRLDEGVTLIQKPFRKVDLIQEIIKSKHE